MNIVDTGRTFYEPPSRFLNHPPSPIYPTQWEYPAQSFPSELINIFGEVRRQRAASITFLDQNGQPFPFRPNGNDVMAAWDSWESDMKTGGDHFLATLEEYYISKTLSKFLQERVCSKKINAEVMTLLSPQRIEAGRKTGGRNADIVLGITPPRHDPGTMLPLAAIDVTHGFSYVDRKDQTIHTHRLFTRFR